MAQLRKGVAEKVRFSLRGDELLLEHTKVHMIVVAGVAAVIVP